MGKIERNVQTLQGGSQICHGQWHVPQGAVATQGNQKSRIARRSYLIVVPDEGGQYFVDLKGWIQKAQQQQNLREPRVRGTTTITNNKNCKKVGPFERA